jgi:hypothetical protein
MRRMALIHRAQLSPTKLELLQGWLPAQQWSGEQGGSGLERVAAYRFDDPAGEVGIETLLVREGDGPVFQVPLTYRGAPLDDADEWLIGTVEHSVLGQRWVYDATGDPVYAAALARALFSGEEQAQEFVDVDGRLEPRPLTMTIVCPSADPAVPAASPRIERVVPGDPTLIETDTVTFAVSRRLGGGGASSGTTLSGSWSGQSELLPLVSGSS